MMLKKFRCLVLVMALILIAVSSTTFAAKKPIKLVYGTLFAVDHYFVKVDRYFKKLVEKKSKGQILIDYFPASQLGDFNEMFLATKSGAQQITAGGLPVTHTPKYWTFELPFLYRNDAHQLKVGKRINSLIDKKELVAKYNIRILGMRIRSPRHLTSKSPVNKIDDIKGLKIRVPDNALSVALWKALGAIPTCIPGTDTYTALATGTVEAQENPLSDIYAWKFYEQTKYCALTAHNQSIYFMYINNDCWNRLTAAQRKILTVAAVKSDRWAEDLRKKSEAEYKELLVKGGMKFTTVDKTSFKKKAQTIWSEFGDAELIKKIKAIK
jgi:tripartite ATP-independent transporter DctP family solute receptor